MYTNKAFGAIEAVRGFMPAEEGIRLGIPGFGELPAPSGQEIVVPINNLFGAFALRGYENFTSQDWHPLGTAHFAQNGEEPNFDTTWPIHCVANTPGAELHPNIVVPGNRTRFIKGFESLRPGEADTSYSVWSAKAPLLEDLSFPEWIAKKNITEVTLGGLCLDFCVGLSAIDIRREAGINVVVAIDATRSISEEGTRLMLRRFEQEGIKVATTDEVIADLRTERI
ncbi:isochorismatase family protein [Candidatus Saccharibacteria bacterium]|nr:isochorismatase family protein [Candidatus Saccharibacteria bacterium]